MKKTKKWTLTTILIICVLMTAGCGATAEKDYYPLAELDSSVVDTETLGYFKEDLQNAGIFDCENFAFRIDFDGLSHVTLYELDETGKALASYQVEGDFANDVVFYTYGTSSWEVQFYQYDFTFDEKEGILEGSRHILEKHELNEEYDVKKIKEQLVRAGYPEYDFTISEEEEVYYGDYQLKGDAADVIIGVAYGLPVWADYYSFTDSEGIIDSVDCNLG